jgi:BirA family biotin operon repressor/biotin-[acetyl-CoA-carboxylase] ligase
VAAPALEGPAVLDLLADGAWHSGVALGESLGLSRAAVWKQVRVLRSLGLTVAADRARGYRLAAPLDLLRGAAIRPALAPATRDALGTLEILTVTTSTNDWLSSRPAPPPGRLLAVAAEYQTGGRGRRGRRWLSPLGHGICLSVAWTFETTPRDLPALSLVAGVVVVEALAALGVSGVQLKWPNDIVAGGGKLGGILVEVAGESGGPLRAVIGIGLNVRRLAGLDGELHAEGGALAAVSLDDLGGGARVSRNELVVALLDGLLASLRQFATAGAGQFLADWRRHDGLAGRPVQVTRGRESFAGVARGLADDGALLVERNGRLEPVVAGDVTLRTPAPPSGACP